MDARYPNRMLLAEANLWPSDVAAYFGDGDECHMAFHFPLMPRLFMALRQEDRHPISEILYQTPDIPATCQWAIFLRNHDELTLEMVTDEERDYMYQTYAADPQMRVNAGIRRRLAPLMENSRRRIELMHGLLLSLPGHARHLLRRRDRDGRQRLSRRSQRRAHADAVDGGSQRRLLARRSGAALRAADHGSGLRLPVGQRRGAGAIAVLAAQLVAPASSGCGSSIGRSAAARLELLRPDNRHIFAFIRRLEAEDPILVVANLARTMQPVTLDLTKYAGLVPVEMSGGIELPRIAESPYFLTLGPYAFYWLVLKRQPAAPLTVRPLGAGAERRAPLPLLLGPDWSRTLAGATRQLLERDYLAPFLRRQSWFLRSGDIDTRPDSSTGAC